MVRAPVSVFDPASQTTLVVGSPRDLPEVWDRYIAAAAQMYEARGVGAALEFEAVRDGDSTRVFAAIVDRAGHVVGGLRVQGCYLSVWESHAVVEWESQRGLSALVAAMGVRLGGGLVEVKSAFADPRATHADLVAGRLARVPLVLMEMTGARFLMATAADYVLSRWESGGGRVETGVSPTPYPDDRYRTRVMFWDRLTVADLAEPPVWDMMVAEFGAAFGVSGSGHIGAAA
ncbi:MAG: hypothetical protein INR66_03590 [Gordonia polyisoprenivorans]|nr:hypothetical protein [Gordonia polyisoprenivorans]